MGKPVTVDSDDLEVLLVASAATREIEKMMRTFANDPAATRVQGKIMETHARLNKQRGEAIRETDNPAPKRFSESILRCLRMLATTANPMGITYDQGWTDEIGTLRAYELVVMGQCNELVVWGDKTESAEALPRQRARITQKGLDWLKEHGHG